MARYKTSRDCLGCPLKTLTLHKLWLAVGTHPGWHPLHATACTPGSRLFFPNLQSNVSRDITISPWRLHCELVIFMSPPDSLRVCSCLGETYCTTEYFVSQLKKQLLCSYIHIGLLFIFSLISPKPPVPQQNLVQSEIPLPSHFVIDLTSWIDSIKFIKILFPI